MKNTNDIQMVTAPQYNTVDMLLNQILGDSLDPSVLASESFFTKADMLIKAGEKLSQIVYGKAV